MNMNLVRTLYRALIPESIRGHVWFLRSFLRNIIHNRTSRRQFLKDFYLSVGKHVSRVRINGVFLYVDLRDYGVGLPLFLHRNYEPVETAFIRQSLQPGMVFVDVGANIGYYTTLAAQAVGPSGRVLAFEPDPYNFSLLELNVRKNGFTNVTLIKHALGACPGEGILTRSPTNFGDHRLYESNERRTDTVRVPMDTLDSALARYQLATVDVIKMDVQGYEQNVLAGMSNILRGNKALVVLTEFWPYGLEMAGGTGREFFESFLSYGFKPTLLYQDGTTSGVAWDEIQTKLPLFDPSHPDSSYLNLAFQK